MRVIIYFCAIGNCKIDLTQILFSGGELFEGLGPGQALTRCLPMRQDGQDWEADNGLVFGPSTGDKLPPQCDPDSLELWTNDDDGEGITIITAKLK